MGGRVAGRSGSARVEAAPRVGAPGSLGCGPGSPGCGAGVVPPGSGSFPPACRCPRVSGLRSRVTGVRPRGAFRLSLRRCLGRSLPPPSSPRVLFFPTRRTRAARPGAAAAIARRVPGRPAVSTARPRAPRGAVDRAAEVRGPLRPRPWAGPADRWPLAIPVVQCPGGRPSPVAAGCDQCDRVRRPPSARWKRQPRGTPGSVPPGPAVARRPRKRQWGQMDARPRPPRYAVRAAAGACDPRGALPRGRPPATS